ncbi:MAG: iron-sulfur protein, partial [Acinetobacter sp.]
FARFSALNEQLPVIEVASKPEHVPVALDSKTTIELAKLRTQIKKLEKQLSVREDVRKRTQLEELTQQLQALQG